MFDYIFPIFAFGLVITGVVIKGLLMAAEMAASLTGEPANTELERPLSARSVPEILRSASLGNDGRNGNQRR